MPTLLDDPSVPLVGQPVKVVGYTIVVSAQCACTPAGTPFQAIVRLEGPLASLCPRCLTVYSVHQMAVNPQGAMGFGFAMQKPADA